MSREYSWDEVKKHNSESSLWIVIDNKVFDVTKFLSDHPGGKKVLVQVAGQDATKKFNLFHKPETLIKYSPQLQIGILQGTGKSSSAVSTQSKQAKPSNPREYGELVPYGDPNWYQSWHSPYYKPYHYKYRQSCRELVEKEVMPYCHEWDEKKEFPRNLFKKFADAGYLAGVIGGKWPIEYCSNIGGGITPEQFDPFCELIMCDELSRAGSGGVSWGLFGGMSIGLPPVYKFGSKQLKDKVCGPCLNGDKTICLAITEPDAGSDVANLKCTATKSEDGKYYIVNGSKKWITNGIFADFFTVAVRTGGEGHSGVSLLVVERGPGVTTKQMQCQGVWASGTTFITFEDVKVPVENLIGNEGEGFKYIMYNFNHERWSICIQATRFARVCLEESMRYAFKRKTFGKLLIEHPVIRLKLAHMARQVEATWAQIESVTYQMSVMAPNEQAKVLGGPIALLKAQATQVLEYCAREAAQIFGGLSYTRGGQGEKVERIYREVRAYAIPGGSEEIMLDLGIRMALKPYVMRMMNKKQKSNL